jgi:hypothetical protein
MANPNEDKDIKELATEEMDTLTVSLAELQEQVTEAVL